MNLKILLFVFLVKLCLKTVTCNDNLRVAYEWKVMDFEYTSVTERNNAIKNKIFVPENVIPVGLEVYKTRLFITLPRWKTGVPASLAYIDINDNSTKSPLLKPFPNWEAHRLGGPDPPEIISPFRVRADKCGRLWVLDTGINDLLDEAQQLSRPRLLVYDLHNDFLIQSFIFPEEDVKEGSFFANIAVEDGDCENTFTYSADLGSPGLVVYSMKQHKSWRMSHHYFHPDPLAGNYSIGGIKFQWDDGLFGLALSKQQPDGYATLYFHPLSSTNEFSVSTRILQNETLATSDNIYREFNILGSRGPNGQAGAAFLDQLTGVLFYALPNLNAVACWKTSNRAYTIKSQGRVYMSTVEMVFPNDVKVDDQDRLWVLSDRLQEFMYSQLKANEINFRILTAHVKDAIENTACDTKPKPLPDLITKLGDILRPTNPPSHGKSGSAKHSSNLIYSVIFIVCIKKLFK